MNPSRRWHIGFLGPDVLCGRTDPSQAQCQNQYERSCFFSFCRPFKKTHSSECKEDKLFYQNSGFESIVIVILLRKLRLISPYSEQFVNSGNHVFLVVCRKFLGPVPPTKQVQCAHEAPPKTAPFSRAVECQGSSKNRLFS